MPAASDQSTPAYPDNSLKALPTPLVLPWLKVIIGLIP